MTDESTPVGEDALEELRHRLAEAEAAIEDEGATGQQLADLKEYRDGLQVDIVRLEKAARDEAGVVDGTAEEVTGADPSDYRPDPTELVVRSAPPGDEQFHETLVTLDKHDENQVMTALEERFDPKLVYSFKDKGGKLKEGLSWQGVMECTRLLNGTTKTRIRILAETLEVVETIEDAGDGPEPYFTATVGAVDEVTGYLAIGTSSEPKNMHKRDGTRPFDVFARAKAINKAQRNALEMHLPERLKAAVIALSKQDATRLLEVRHGAGASAAAALPPPVATPRAHELEAACRELYKDIRVKPGGMQLLMPGNYNRRLERARSSEDALEAFRDELVSMRDHITKEAQA